MDPSSSRQIGRIISELGEEGIDQLFMVKMREKNKRDREAQWAAEDAQKTAGGANFPPISGPTCTSGINTSQQQEEKLKRAPVLPKPEDKALSSMDIDKISSFLAGICAKTAEVPVEQDLQQEAELADRRYKVLSNALGSSITMAGMTGIPSGIISKSPRHGLLMGGAGALGGAAMGSLFGAAQSAATTRKKVEDVYNAEGDEGLKDLIARRGPSTATLIPGLLSGGVGLGTSLLLHDRFKMPWADQSGLKKLVHHGMNIGVTGGIPLATSSAAWLASEPIVDAYHGTKTSEEYDYMNYPHHEHIPEDATAGYSDVRQGLLYGASMLHPLGASVSAAATANPGEHLSQLGRTLAGSLAGDAVGGLAGLTLGGPSGYILGSYVGRPVGTYIAHHMD
jgi:hypothetical protein